MNSMGAAANLPAQYLQARLTDVGEIALVATFVVVLGAWWIAGRAPAATSGHRGGAPGSSVRPASLSEDEQAGRAAGHRAGWWQWFEAGPPGRTLLQVAFGGLWVLDGLLQAQASMPRGFGPMVVEPTLAGQPGWVVDLGHLTINLWSLHTVTTDAFTVFVQIAIGVGILLGGDSGMGRTALSASVAWGLVVWLMGEGAGDVFGKGATWLSGAPGGVLVYVVIAVVLLAVPARRWDDATMGRRLAVGIGALMLLAAFLQGLPWEGFWHGGRLAQVFAGAAGNSQPAALAGPILAVEHLARAHPFDVNALCTAVPLALGIWLITRYKLDWAMAATLVWGFATWWIGMDFGVLGGTGTDPNIAGPVGVVLLAAWLGVRHRAPVAVRDTRAPTTGSSAAYHRPLRMPRGIAIAAAGGSVAGSGPRTGPGPATGTGAPAHRASGADHRASGSGLPGSGSGHGRSQPATDGTGLNGARDHGPSGTTPAPTSSWWRRHPVRVWVTCAASLAALWLAVPVLGTVPHALHQPSGETLAYVQSGGLATIPAQPPMPVFTLVNQYGKPVSSSSFRGKVVLLSFLDPVCYATCPVVVQEMTDVARLLAARAPDIELVAINANPYYTNPASLRAFDAEHGISGLGNWQYLTGTPAQLEAIWRRFGALTQVAQVGMVAHSLLVYIIGPNGHEHALTAATGVPGARIEAAYAEMFADEAASLLPHG